MRPMAQAGLEGGLGELAGALRSLLADFAESQGLSASISPRIGEKVNGYFEDKEPRRILNKLCSTYGLVWYFDGSTLHFNRVGEIRSRNISLQFLPWHKLFAALKENGVAPFTLANSTRWPGAFWLIYLATRSGDPETFINAYNREEGASFEDEAFVKAGERIQELVEMDAFVQGFNGLNYDTGESRAQLWSGDAAMELMGDWQYNTALEEAPHLARILRRPLHDPPRRYLHLALRTAPLGRRPVHDAWKAHAVELSAAPDARRCPCARQYASRRNGIEDITFTRRNRRRSRTKRLFHLARSGFGLTLVPGHSGKQHAHPAGVGDPSEDQSGADKR